MSKKNKRPKYTRSGYLSQEGMDKRERRTHNRIKRNIPKIRDLVAMGATMLEIAQLLNIAETTLYQWRKKEPRLEQAIQEGWTEADRRVNESLTKLIVGGQQVKEEFYESSDGSSSKRVTIDTKNPNMEAIKYFEHRYNSRVEAQKSRLNKPIVRDDLKYLSDEELVEILNSVKEGDLND